MRRGHRRHGSTWGHHWAKHKKNADGGPRVAHKRHRRAAHDEIQEHLDSRTGIGNMEAEPDKRAGTGC